MPPWAEFCPLIPWPVDGSPVPFRVREESVLEPAEPGTDEAEVEPLPEPVVLPELGRSVPVEPDAEPVPELWAKAGRASRESPVAMMTEVT